jgi:hypothetical protein
MQQVHKVVLCSSMESLTARVPYNQNQTTTAVKKNYRKLETVNVSIN